eukprot:2638410-Rhodomonas_salina.1
MSVPHTSNHDTLCQYRTPVTMIRNVSTAHQPVPHITHHTRTGLLRYLGRERPHACGQRLVLLLPPFATSVPHVAHIRYGSTARCIAAPPRYISTARERYGTLVGCYSTLLRLAATLCCYTVLLCAFSALACPPAKRNDNEDKKGSVEPYLSRTPNLPPTDKRKENRVKCCSAENARSSLG